ncbi:phosphatidylglycerophosphatase [Pasteurella langaaensis DSM 22999]|uniref:Phosphatidylglycerophosphatase A n=1 Tax=Alitibacter langaaensis DSM 22999 TaxID=1122935 RepID=A0A2U0TAH7_9PAST|nr:phosphatidylglycerophosphatase A [Pasteurella langaaensis]PVX40606.1 phosphatidylglycerophosphatase [Pasteurella langaaensis DSM 22999]
MTENPLSRLKLTNPIHLLALGFGSGLIHPAPGTWGSLLGVILGASFLACFGQISFVILTALSFFIGCYLCHKTAKDMGVHDHGSIVWDEFVGVWLCLLAIPEVNFLWCAIAFVLFRLFDIWKPFPIRQLDAKLESGFGIMIDDILAAVYGFIVIMILRVFL